MNDAMNAGIKCSGRKADGGACRRLTRGTVAGGHAACPPHKAQVEAREADLAARKAAARQSSPRPSP